MNETIEYTRFGAANWLSYVDKMPVVSEFFHFVQVSCSSRGFAMPLLIEKQTCPTNQEDWSQLALSAPEVIKPSRFCNAWDDDKEDDDDTDSDSADKDDDKDDDDAPVEIDPLEPEEEDDPFDDFDDEDFDDDFDDDFEEELDDDYEIEPDDSEMFPQGDDENEDDDLLDEDE